MEKSWWFIYVCYSFYGLSSILDSENQSYIANWERRGTVRHAGAAEDGGVDRRAIDTIRHVPRAAVIEPLHDFIARR